MPQTNRKENDEKLLEIPKRALLVSVYKASSDKFICEEHLDELAFLAKTHFIETAERVPCLIKKYESSTFVTQGKLEELLKKSQELNVDLIIFDDEISPAQQRNLEKAFGKQVMDRTELILEVFAQRAQTKEARLQIELAKVKYQAPRLKRMWTHLSRQAGSAGGGTGGGGGYLKGEGETQIEIDRRILKRQIDQLQKEIKEVKGHREVQRSARQKSVTPVFSIIGYTNAGKSTLLNALTDAKVFVEDKLFATLDTTTRKYTLTNNQEVLMTDTVGFIRKLPHLVVAAFKSTLEEAIQADILLHMIDVSHPMAEEQAQTTMEVLKELGAENKPIITVLNKIDKCTDAARIQRLRFTYPKTVQISATKKQGFSDLEEVMIQELNKQQRQVVLRIPQSHYAIVSEIMRSGNIVKQEYDDNDVILKVDLPIALANKYSQYAIKT